MDNSAFAKEDQNQLDAEISDKNATQKSENGYANHVTTKQDEAELKSDADDETVDEYDGKCGAYACAPSWMQRFTQPRWILVQLCMLAFIQGFAINGINNVNTTSYERRFQLKSNEAGAVSSAYDFSAGILVLPVSYFGALLHKPRLVGIAAIILGLGSFSMSIAHFATGPYEAGEGINKLCNATAKDCDSNSTTYLSNFLYLLIFGQLLHGIAGTILYTVGVSTIDDNVSDRTSPLYIGIFYTFAGLGPALGFAIGAQFLSLYVDFEKNLEVTLTPDDPRWIGAWWLGFIASFSLAIVVGLLLFLFPRETPKAPKLRAIRAKTNPDGQQHTHDTLRDSMKEIPQATLRLLKQPTFVLLSLAGTTEAMVVSGYGTFLPKFIRNQFNQTDSMAALLTGALAIPGMAGGIFFGGLIMKKTGWRVRGMLRFNAVVSILTIVAATVLFAQCPQSHIAGINLSYDLQKSTETEFKLNLIATCNMDCDCNQEYYDPVCVNDKVEYFTPCYAGCKGQTINKDGTKDYHNCSCITSHMTSNNQSIVASKCGKSCVYMYVFIVVFFFVMLFTFLAQAPATSATLRCIADKDKTYALGVQWVIVRFLGSVPGPIMFGAIIDSTCALWQVICGEEKSCWIYNNVTMSRNFFIITIACKGLTFIFFALASIVYKPIVSSKVQVLEDTDHQTLGNGDVNVKTADTTL